MRFGMLVFVFTLLVISLLSTSFIDVSIYLVVILIWFYQGDNVPDPFMTFEAAGLPPEILKEASQLSFLFSYIPVLLVNTFSFLFSVCCCGSPYRSGLLAA